jgi:pyruvate/2-oxoglutarate dehydrogenase complex dihydrolipoamide acyltransferase (E2) component
VSEAAEIAARITESDTIYLLAPIRSEVNSDKVEMEVESPADGTLVRHTAAEGDGVPVGAPIARLATEAEHLLGGVLGPADGGGDGATAAAPAPAARRRAAGLGVDLATVADVEEVPLSSMRRVVARRQVESMQSAPHFYLTTVVDAEALLAFRADLNGQLDGDLKVSVDDLVVKACATLLRADLNVSFGGDSSCSTSGSTSASPSPSTAAWWSRWSATPTT